MLKKLSAIILCGHGLFLSANVFARTEEGLYKDERVQFAYPKTRYVEVKADDAVQGGFYTYSLHLKSIDAHDVLTVCRGDIRKCGSNDGVKPYWYSEDGTLMLFSATSIVSRKMSVGSGQEAYEAFAACPTTDNTGQSHAYGAECYELVVSAKGSTVSITYWIGKAPSRASKINAAKKASRILNSVRMK